MNKKLYDKLMSNLWLLAGLNLMFPFINVSFMRIEISPDKSIPYFVTYSPFDIVLKGIKDLFIYGFDTLGLQMLFYIVLIFVIIALAQLSGFYFKKPITVISTGLILLTSTITMLYFAVQSNLDIKFGFYTYIALQASIIVLSIIPKIQERRRVTETAKLS